MSRSETRRQMQMIMLYCNANHSYYQHHLGSHSGIVERTSGAGDSTAHLRLQKVLFAHLGSQFQLSLEEVDVLLGVVQNPLQQVA